MSRSLRPRAGRLTPVQPSPAPAATPAASSSEAPPLQSLLQELRVRGRNRTNNLGTSLGSAIEAIWTNRTRSLLTMLGIVIGISAVIGALTLTQGVGAYLQNVIAGMGTNTIIVESGSPQSQSKNSSRPLSLQDYLSLGSLSHVSAISPLITSNGLLVYGNQNWQTRVIGGSVDLQTIQSWDMADGLWFSQAQQDGASSVVVLGDTVAQNLFGPSGAEPVGKQVRIGTQLFKVIGVTAAKGESGFGISDDEVFIPYKAALTRFKGGLVDLNQIYMQSDTSTNVDLVVQEITNTLERTHHIARGTPDDFQTTTSTQLLQQANQSTQAITLLLVGIATISLTVGGIGIMNIMLVSVTERTREIGIRMSIGARRADIRTQFLIEALLLCLLGGLIGLGLGILLGWSSTSLIANLIGGGGGARGGGRSTTNTIPLVITTTTVVLPFVVASVIGLVFGFYPAVRASLLDPIVALRRRR